MKKYMKILFLVLFVISNTGCTALDYTDKAIDITSLSDDFSEATSVREFELVADEKIVDGREKWLFNGNVSGEEIRVTIGELVKVNVSNKLQVPITVHFHGMIFANKMDGVPGITQNSIMPGDTFKYEFIANRAGSYMYHSHQKTRTQVSKGLFGSLVIEPKEKEYDRDFTFIFDKPLDYVTNRSSGMMGRMDESLNYNQIVVNGESKLLEPIQIQKNQRIRIRLLNIGSTSQYVDFGGVEYEIVSIDATDTINRNLFSKVLELPGGTRYDVEIEPRDSFSVKTLERNVENVVVPFEYDGKDINTKDIGSMSLVDIYEEVEMKALFTEEELNRLSNRKFEMVLSGGMGRWTINGKAFPKPEDFEIEEGDIVLMKLSNQTMMGMDHPMHLHGHVFEVISKNGEKLKNPIVQDTINVSAGDWYVIAIRADNPGKWIFHCHNLVHAEGGMIATLSYVGYKTPFKINNNNMPH